MYLIKILKLTLQVSWFLDETVDVKGGVGLKGLALFVVSAGIKEDDLLGWSVNLQHVLDAGNDGFLAHDLKLVVSLNGVLVLAISTDTSNNASAVFFVVLHVSWES